MTIDERIKISNDDAIAFDTAIKASEQQICRDCISRTDLIATMHLLMDDAVIGDNDEDYESLDDIKQQYLAIAEGLRAVQSPRPGGEWNKIGQIGPLLAYKCSICKGIEVTKSNFCPNCGADMKGEA